MNRPGWGPILALAGLAVFSFAFTLAAKHGLWPQLPPGALHDTDLWAGLAGGLVLVALLLRTDRRSDGVTGRRGDGENGKTIGSDESC
ncbi:MAG TPA: hypothetical protein VK780_04620 [Thermoanaerobaculia bacterium]|nr:hypothetical protein [Thermoanaerobaculia bacterium]